MKHVEDHRLNGWKAIGNFVGRDERTVRRWEAERGLPVHRVPGGGSATVWADPTELKAWLDSGRAEAAPLPDSVEPDPPNAQRRLWRPVAIASLGLIGAAALAPVVVQSVVQKTETHKSMPTPYGNDDGANALFRDAMFGLNRRSVKGLASAVRGFDTLTKNYPQNAAGWVGLADAYLLMREFNSLPDEAGYRRAEQAAQTAIRIAPDLAGANRTLGFIRFHGDGRLDEGLKLLERATLLDPAQAQAHHWYGTALLGAGKLDAAAKALRKAQALAPESSAITTDLAVTLFTAGMQKEAIDRATAVTEIDPEFSGAWRHLARFHVARGEDQAFLHAAAIDARLREDKVQAQAVARAAKAFATGGRAAMLASLVASEEARFNETGGSALRVASWYAISGNAAQTRAWLARGESLGTPEIRTVPGYLEFAPFRDDPAFARWMKPQKN